MPDSFFSSKNTRKRKRVSSKDSGPSSSKKILRTSNGRVSAKGKGKDRTVDEDLHSGGSGSEALDDLDLRADEVDPNESGEEDADETPAQKRLRLAKLYLESIKEDIGANYSYIFCSVVLILVRWRAQLMERSTLPKSTKS
jgi:ribosomal RNA-processing protein 9